MKYVIVETVSVFTHKYLIAQDNDDDFTQEHCDEVITRRYEVDDGDIREAMKNTPYNSWGLPQIKETLSYYKEKEE